MLNIQLSCRFDESRRWLWKTEHLPAPCAARVCPPGGLQGEGGTGSWSLPAGDFVCEAIGFAVLWQLLQKVVGINMWRVILSAIFLLY